MLEQAQQKAAELALKKAKAAAAGNLRQVKQYDLALKTFLLENGLVASEDVGKIRLDPGVEANLKADTIQKREMLAKYKVPAWFRTGYDGALRVQLWLRLSRRYRKFLMDQHNAGNLPVYAPSPSYWAKHIRPSDFYKKPEPAKIEQEVVKEVAAVSPQAAASPVIQQEATQVAEVIEKVEEKAMEVADLELELAAENVEEQALMDSLEQPGKGMLRSEEKWYEDPSKSLFIFAGALLLISAMKD